jgi:formate hydrogenlyase subunit 6/NADH:ubiquinone oxidoreductase subunit I
MKVLAADKLGELAAALTAAGYRVIAPVEDTDARAVRLSAWSPSAVIRTDAVPVNSVKDVLLPPSEVIGRYDLQGADFTVRDVVAQAPKTVVLCARPCDAAALTLLDTIFNWDFPDAFYNAHRAATTVVSLACSAPDENCFCTSVGGKPDNTSGADAILRPAERGTKLILEPVTDKGAALAAACGTMLAEAAVTADPPPVVPKRFDQATITAWLEGHFDSPLWQQWAMACLGCGACAYACPTCHCFDIQDEATRTESVRLRNWDTCGLSLFTQHASGHNPRRDQTARRRQRIMHKFSYIPERFGLIGCVGCGRCARVCAAAQGIVEICQAIEKADASAKKVPVK